MRKLRGARRRTADVVHACRYPFAPPWVVHGHGESMEDPGGGLSTGGPTTSMHRQWQSSHVPALAWSEFFNMGYALVRAINVGIGFLPLLHGAPWTLWD